MKARSPLRAATRLVSILAVLVSALAISGTSYADEPPPGNKGCVGSPEIPKAFVCVVSLTPENAVPAVGTTTIYTQRVPVMCYYVGCTDPMYVPVPGPTVTPNGGSIAVIYYDGTNYPVVIPGVSADELLAALQALAQQAIDLVLGVAGGLEPLVAQALHLVASNLIVAVEVARFTTIGTTETIDAAWTGVWDNFTCSPTTEKVCGTVYRLPLTATRMTRDQVNTAADTLVGILAQY